MSEEKNELIKITVDGKEIEVKPGTRVIEAAKMVQDDVPYYCYHPGLSIAGNCRMCLVEVEGMPKLQIACHMEARDGMVIQTQNERVKKTREHTLEFLLINHPVDCPVCDQAGECWLQDYYMKHGLYDSRLNEDKVKKPKAVPLGPTVMLDAERCILCSRCVRFTDEVSKTQELGISNRGDHSEVQVFPGMELNNAYSGNVVDICPVGALTDRDFRFKIRVWYLKSENSLCNGCSRGCNVQVHYNLDRPHHGDGRVKRLKPRYNEDVNKWWMCDEGRYGYKFHDDGRLSSENDISTTLADISEKIKENKKFAVVLSPQMANEDLYVARKFFREEVKASKIILVSPKPEGAEDDILIKADKNPNTRGAQDLTFDYDADDMSQLTQKIESGEIEGLFIFGQDLISLYGGQGFGAAFEKLKWSVFIGSNENETSKKSTYLIPATTYIERPGTFTNFEGRIQAFNKVVEPLNGAKPEWLVIKELGAYLGVHLGFENEADIFNELTTQEKAFNGLKLEELLGDEAKIRTQAAPTIPALQQYDNIL